MNGRLLLLPSDKMTHDFKQWMTPSGVLKKIYCLYKNLIPKIDPFNSSYSQKTSVPLKKIKAISTPKEQLFGESNCSESHLCKCKCLQLLF